MSGQSDSKEDRPLANSTEGEVEDNGSKDTDSPNSEEPPPSLGFPHQSFSMMMGEDAKIWALMEKFNEDHVTQFLSGVEAQGKRVARDRELRRRYSVGIFILSIIAVLAIIWLLADIGMTTLIGTVITVISVFATWALVKFRD